MVIGVILPLTSNDGSGPGTGLDQPPVRHRRCVDSG
jgi:hypothetical protein